MTSVTTCSTSFYVLYVLYNFQFSGVKYIMSCIIQLLLKSYGRIMCLVLFHLSRDVILYFMSYVYYNVSWDTRCNTLLHVSCLSYDFMVSEVWYIISCLMCIILFHMSRGVIHYFKKGKTSLQRVRPCMVL